MTIRRSARKSTTPLAASDTLMGNQDTRGKGDSAAHRRKDKCVTFWVTAEKKAEYSAYADEHGMTLSRLIVEALEARMRG